jgi:hypothetical protein
MHPKRQMASEVKLLVRSRELACRNSWGDDVWQPIASSHATTLQPSTHRGLTIQASAPDDQVTSVSTTSQPVSEDTVTHTAIRSDRVSPPSRDERTFDHNAGAIADQDERARVMARGSRDAIFSARQRHVQRRVPRPTIEPDRSSPEPESDRVIEAVDRTAHTTPVPAKPVSETPPVPRDEVIARGQRLSPASGVDERFDSVPTFNPNVDLPRLRRFFNGAAQPESDQSRSESSYDLVLQRAREFKDATSGHQSGVSQRSSMYAPQPPAQTPAGTTPQAAKPAEADVLETDKNPVVWDVDTSSLKVVFERTRNAIAGHDPGGPTLDPDDDNDGTLEADDIDVVMHHDDRFVPESAAFDVWSDEAKVDDAIAFDDPVAAAWVETETEWIDATADAEPGWIDASAEVEPEWIEEPTEPVADRFALEHQHEEAPQAQPAKPRVDESPRSSWWRSLNFGRKRRYHPEPEPAVEEVPFTYADGATEALDAYGYDDAYANDAFGDASTVQAVANDAAYDDADYLDDGEEAHFEDDFAADEQHYAAESTLIRDRYAITSEDSWLEDERYFPDPQPPNWYEERTRLLASRPEPEPLPAPVSFGESRQAPPPEPEPVAHPQRRVRREPGSYFAINEPGGMSAFRAALFSDDPGSDVREERPAAFQRRPLPEREATDRLDQVFAGNRDDEPTPMEPLQRRAEPRTRAAAPIRFTQHKAMFDESFDIGDTISEDDGKPHEYELASRVSKACWTCRSFRAADEGRSGWCMNEWAPTHRQMVDAEDIACHSSIGDWWIAADTTWIPPVDRIVPETPRTDRLAARSQQDDTRDARESRRVRTRKVV